MCNSGKIGKTDITKVGLNSIEDPTIQNNLMGKSRFMNKKDWTDASGRKGKVSRGSGPAPPGGASRKVARVLSATGRASAAAAVAERES